MSKSDLKKPAIRMEKWNVHPESLRIIEYNLPFDKFNWLSITHVEVEDTKGYIKASIEDMQSLLVDIGNNIAVEEEGFSKVEDGQASLRCNFSKVCKPSLEGNIKPI